MSSPAHRSASRGRSRTPAERATSAADNMDVDNDQPNGARVRTRSLTHSRSPSRDRDRNRSRSRSYRSRSRSYTRSPSHSRSRSPSLPRSAKIVIEKLTKNVNEAHLREMFSSYGDIVELEMPMNPQFMMNKGIAYILFTQASYAESAIAHMHEAQLDGALINVSIVLPRRRFSRSPPMKRPPPDRFGEPHRLRQGGPPPMRGGMGMGGPLPMRDRPYGGARGAPMGHRASPSYGADRRSPPRRYGGGGGRGGGGGYRDRYDDRDSYRPRTLSRSPPPRRRRSPSYGSRSRSPTRSPPPRRRDFSPPRGGRRRRSPSYDSFSSRSRSRSRHGRGGRR